LLPPQELVDVGVEPLVGTYRYLFLELGVGANLVEVKLVTVVRVQPPQQEFAHHPFLHGLRVPPESINRLEPET
jgi:hypothetical protein